MSVQQEAVELERHNAHLSSELDGDAPWTIHGIAIGEGDVTRGQSGIRKKWPREALKPGSESLEGRPLVQDHDNSSKGVVGEVINADYKDGVGVLYEAELYDQELAERIANGLLEVSIRGYHGDVDEMEKTENGAKLVQTVRFDNLSIVPTGAAPSNTAQMGPSSELSAAECAAMMGVDVDEETDELAHAPQWEEGQMVQWQSTPEMFGKIVHVDTERHVVMVEIHEMHDGEPRSTGFTNSAGYSDLVPFERDEEMEESDELADTYNEGDLVEWEWSGGTAHGRVEAVFTDAGEEVERTFDGNEVTRTVEEDRPVYELEVWREDDQEFSGGALKYHDKLSTWSSPPEMVEEAQEFGEGDFVFAGLNDSPLTNDENPQRGVIEEVVYDGVVEPDNLSNNSPVSGSEQNPVAVVKLFEYDDGAWTPSGARVAKRFSALEMWDAANDAVEAGAHHYTDGDDLYAESLKAHFDRLGDGYIPVTGYEEKLSEAQLQEEVDEVYSEWSDHVNMSASQLQSWSENPCSREASVDPQAVIKRNLRLLETNKEDWTAEDVKDAKRTISFISRMSDEANEPENPKDGANGCPSEWAISLLNWAYNPFDSIPSIPDEMDAMEPVELRAEGAEEEGNPQKFKEEPERYPEGQDTPEENMQAAELQDYSMHTPEWSGTTEGEWSRPNLEDFASEYDFDSGTDFGELSEDTRQQIANHFLLAQGEFPPENYSDLNLPVVEPNGDLSLSALRTVKGGRGAQAVEGLGSDMEERIMEWVNETAASEFDEDWGDEEEAAKHGMSKDHDDVYMDESDAQDRADEIGCETVHEMEMDGDTVYMPCSSHAEYQDMVGSASKHGDNEDEMADCPTCTADDADEAADASDEAGQDDGNTVTVLSADRSIPVVSSANEDTGNESVKVVASDNTGDTTMTDEITEDELSELRQKADAYDELQDDGEDEASAVEELKEEFQSDLEELKERTAILDDVQRSDVEALRETDNPHVMEQARFEELEESVDTVRDIYAESLARHVGLSAEKLADKLTLEELREELEDQLEDDETVEDELSPAPQGSDPDEEELEERDAKRHGESEELSDEAQAKQEEIRQRILNK